MNKQTNENWHLQFEEDNLPIERAIELKKKDKGWYPDQPKPFDPPAPQTDTENAFDDCVRKGKSNVYYSIDIKDLDSYPIYQKFLELKKQLYKNWYDGQPEHKRLMSLMTNPRGNTKDISELVSSMRNNLKMDPRIGNVYFADWPYDFLNQVFPTEILKRDDLSTHSDYLIKGGYWDDEFKLVGSLKNPVKVEYLYHWSPKIHLENILKNGLLPGFVTQDSPGFKNYVWAAVQENAEWFKMLGKKQLGDVDWVMLRIKYDPEKMFAYYPLIGSWPVEDKFFDDPVHMVVRNSAIPLSDMLTIQRNRDLKQIRFEAHKRRDELLESKWIWGVTGMDTEMRVQEMKKLGYGLWSYSKMHGCWIPPEMSGLENPQQKWSPDNLSYPSTSNEVRLDYVGPEYIEVVKEESF